MGAAILLVVGLLALLGPLLAPHSAIAGSLSESLRPPVGYEDGSWSHPLGTDELGRDVLSRLMGGARTTVLIGLAGVLLAGAVGTVLGIVAGKKASDALD